jgi:shikimate kinase
MKQWLIAGLPGSGKSTLLTFLKEELTSSWGEFGDLDLIIESKMQKSCADLIKGEGWEYFRAIEKKCFFDFIKKDSNFILSLGGGTIPEAVLPKEISDHLNIIWLQRTDEEILLHLKSMKGRHHPLNQFSESEMKEKFEYRTQALNQCFDRIEKNAMTLKELKKMAIAIAWDLR